MVWVVGSLSLQGHSGGEVVSHTTLSDRCRVLASAKPMIAGTGNLITLALFAFRLQDQSLEPNVPFHFPHRQRTIITAIILDITVR